MPHRVLGLPSSSSSGFEIFRKAKFMYNNFKDSMKYLLYVEISLVDIGQTSKISVNYRPCYVTNEYKLICICPQSEILKVLIFAFCLKETSYVITVDSRISSSNYCQNRILNNLRMTSVIQTRFSTFHRKLSCSVKSLRVIWLNVSSHHQGSSVLCTGG